MVSSLSMLTCNMNVRVRKIVALFLEEEIKRIFLKALVSDELRRSQAWLVMLLPSLAKE